MRLMYAVQNQMLPWTPLDVLTSASGESRYPSKADVWAVGMLALELATGANPLMGHQRNQARCSRTRLYYSHCRQVVSELQSDPPALPKSRMWSAYFLDFAASCLRKEPQARGDISYLLNHGGVHAITGP